MIGMELTLSDWLYNAVVGMEVLSISRDYFRIGKPIERRIYELCRRHCGSKQPKWEIGIDKLRKETFSCVEIATGQQKANLMGGLTEPLSRFQQKFWKIERLLPLVAIEYRWLFELFLFDRTQNAHSWH